MGLINEHIRQSILILNHIYEEDVSPLYFETNEKLNTVFDAISVKDKDVLTVLSSSDHLFSSYYCGAQNVDTFDINPLTFYYYYLRKWSLLQRDTPVVSFCDNNSLKELLSLPKSTVADEKSNYYWDTMLQCHPSVMTSNLFYTTGASYYEHNVPFKEDYMQLKRVMEDKQLSFLQQDLYSPTIIDKQYDVIFLSNILEHNNGDIAKLMVVRDNLLKLVKDDGVVVATHLMRGDIGGDSLERQVMEQQFVFSNGVADYNSIYQQDMPVFYTYKKRCYHK